MTFQRILVAIDGSSVAAAVFDQAVKLAFTHESHLMLLHCFHLKTWDEISIMINAAFGPPGRGKLQQLQEKEWLEREQARKSLQIYCQQAKAYGIQAEYEFCLGEPSWRILEFAQNWCADLIIMGRKNRNLLVNILRKSIDNYIIEHASCSVLIIQEPRLLSCQDNNQLLYSCHLHKSKGFFFPSKRMPQKMQLSYRL